MQQIKKEECSSPDIASKNTAATQASKLEFNNKGIRDATDEEEKQNEDQKSQLKKLELPEIWLVAMQKGYDLVEKIGKGSFG